MVDIHISIDFGDAQTSKGKLTKVKGSPVRDPEPDNGPGIFHIRQLTSPMVCRFRQCYEDSSDLVLMPKFPRCVCLDAGMSIHACTVATVAG